MRKNLVKIIVVISLMLILVFVGGILIVPTWAGGIIGGAVVSVVTKIGIFVGVAAYRNALSRIATFILLSVIFIRLRRRILRLHKWTLALSATSMAWCIAHWKKAPLWRKVVYCGALIGLLTVGALTAGGIMGLLLVLPLRVPGWAAVFFRGMLAFGGQYLARFGVIRAMEELVERFVPDDVFLFVRKTRRKIASRIIRGRRRGHKHTLNALARLRERRKRNRETPQIAS